MRAQFAKLEYALNNRFQLVYLEAPLDSAPGPGVLPYFENCGPYSCWVSDDKTLSADEKRREEDDLRGESHRRCLQHPTRDPQEHL